LPKLNREKEKIQISFILGAVQKDIFERVRLFWKRRIEINRALRG